LGREKVGEVVEPLGSREAHFEVAEQSYAVEKLCKREMYP
jgi:hypothetical protein